MQVESLQTRIETPLHHGSGFKVWGLGFRVQGLGPGLWQNEIGNIYSFYRKERQGAVKNNHYALNLFTAFLQPPLDRSGNSKEAVCSYRIRGGGRYWVAFQSEGNFSEYRK